MEFKEYEGSHEKAAIAYVEQLMGYLDIQITDDKPLDHLIKIVALSKVISMVCLSGEVGYDLFSKLLKKDFSETKKTLKK